MAREHWLCELLTWGLSALRRPSNHREDIDDVRELGGFLTPGLSVLLSLAHGSMPARCVSDTIAADAGVRPGPGTLCGSLARLERYGLIARSTNGNGGHAYALTTRGVLVLKGHTRTRDRESGTRRTLVTA